MNILDELTDKFSAFLDASLMQSARYRTATAKLDDYVCNNLTEEQAAKISDIVGDLSGAVFQAAAKGGMKLGASIAAELFGGESHV